MQCGKRNKVKNQEESIVQLAQKPLDHSVTSKESTKIRDITQQPTRSEEEASVSVFRWHWECQNKNVEVLSGLMN